MALITAAEARLFVPSLTGTAEDTNLDALILRADQVLAAWCGYRRADGGDFTLESATYTAFLPGPGGRRLRLPVYPIVTLTSIEDDTDEVFDGTTNLVASTDYVSRDAEGIVLLKTSAVHGAWSTSRQEVIKAVFDAGWSTVPNAIKLATAMLVSHWHGLRHTAGLQSASNELGGTNAWRTEQIPDSVKQIIEPYRLHTVYMASAHQDDDQTVSGRRGLIWQ